MQNHAKKRFNNTSINAMVAIAISAVLIFSAAGMKGAFADVVINDIVVDDKTVSIIAGETTTVRYQITVGDNRTPEGDRPGCNVNGANPATLAINTPSGVTATPSSLTITACDTWYSVDFTSENTGDYQITVDASGGRTGSAYDESPATFSLAVDAGGDTGGGGGDTGGGGGTTDTTDPVLHLPGNIEKEATGPEGATVTYDVSAEDDSGGPVNIDCSPASGSTFPLGETTVSCTATDEAENSVSGDFTVTVVDTTDPILTVPESQTVEATSPDGATDVTYDVSATDLVDPSPTITCEPSGSTFPLGETTVSCTATDASGNTSPVGTFTINVVDTTAPTLTVPESQTVEATSPDGATDVTYDVSATDLVDPSPTITCEPTQPASGSTFPLGPTTVSCTATDASGNTSPVLEFTITVVDTTAPRLTVPADITQSATGPNGAAVTFTATATDTVDTTPTITCQPASGSTFPLGPTTVSCTATDDSQNTSPASTFKVTITLRIEGFYQPVDNNGVTNLVKVGSTVPMKFEVFAGSTELTDTSVRDSVSQKKVNCASGGTIDEIEQYTTTGQTVFRYDTTSGQFIDNWKAPTTKNVCYLVTMTFDDGTAKEALFRTK